MVEQITKKYKENKKLDNSIKALRDSQNTLKNQISELETLATKAQQKLDTLEDECSDKIDKITKVALNNDYEIDAKGNVVISAIDYLNLLKKTYTMKAYEAAGIDNRDEANFAINNYEEKAGCTIDQMIVTTAYQIAANGGFLPDDFFKSGISEKA